MKILEVRRHSLRKRGGGSQLSQVGVEAARTLGSTLGPFDQVVTTVSPRARETAIALGFAVDYEVATTVAEEDFYPEVAHSRWWEAPDPFVVLAQVLAAQGAAYRYAHSLLGLWRDILTALPPKGQALFIGHSGELEMAVVAGFPHADHATWGQAFGHLEGAQLCFDGDPERFVSMELLRT